MKTFLGVVVNAIAGILVIIVILGIGFAGGGLPSLVAGVLVCCFIGFALAYVCALRGTGYVWAYGLAYVALPLIFVYSSENGAKTDEMRLIWTSVLSVVYAASMFGGILAYPKCLVCRKNDSSVRGVLDSAK